MRELARPLLLIGLALAVPIVPFVVFGDTLERQVESWFDPPPSDQTVAALTIAVLASDIVLPVPSSMVSTLAGARLGLLAGTLASWLGLTLGASLGFYLARRWGRPLARRFSSAADLNRIDRVAALFGPGVLVLARPLPVLAEASVLLLGASGLAWQKFLPATMLSNLGIAITYSALGQLAQTRHELPPALGASIALPLAAAILARWLLPARLASESNELSQIEQH